MFDRIAGVYDLMNTVMTAGLHHRWRARAAELAEIGPGEPRARRRDRHRRPGDRAGSAGRRPAARWSAATSPRGCSSGPARRPRAPEPTLPRASNGPTRSRCPTRTTRFDAATVGLRRAQLRRPRPRPAEMVARGAARRPGRGARDHDPHAAAAVAASTGSGSTASCRRSGLAAGDARGAPLTGAARAPRVDRRRLHLPAELGQALPGPAELAAELERAGLDARSATCSPPAASSRSTPAPCRARRRMSAVDATERPGRRSPRSGRARRDHAARRARRCASDGAHRGAPDASHRRGRRAAGLARQRDGRRRRQAAAAAARGARGRVRRRPARSPGGRGAPACGRPWRSSWSTPRRSSTTT